MNCNHYILIVVSLILIFEAFYDYLSKKFKSLPKKEKFKFLPKKGNQRFFLYFIYLFPLIITSFDKEFNIFNSIKNNMSFYATALTITFTVYSFLETQKVAEEDRRKRDDKEKAEREEREAQREYERIESENKDFELREKELDAERDYYRPIFIIESNKVKLLMRSPDLYLENVQFFSEDYENQRIPKVKNLKSGATIKEDFTTPFFITGQTLIGENILFGYMNGKVKIYRYQKEAELGTYPEVKEGIYNLESFNKSWPYFNNYSNMINPSLESIFFEKTFMIRGMIAKFGYYELFSESLNTKTIEEFYEYIFQDLLKIIFRYNITNNSLNEVLQILLNNKHFNNIGFDTNDLNNTLKAVLDNSINNDTLFSEYDLKNTNLLVSIHSLCENPKVNMHTIINKININLEYLSRNLNSRDFKSECVFLFIFISYLIFLTKEYNLEIIKTSKSENIISIKSSILEKLVFEEIV